MSITGEYTKGEPLIQEALRIRRALYGTVHADIAESIGDLGVNYGERGEFAQAEVYLREALAMQRKVHGAIHPQIAEAMNNLGWALMGLNHPEQAEPLYRDVLQMKRKLLGDAHPELAAGLNNLAFALETRGDYAAAEAAYRESLAMNRKLLGDKHPEIAVFISTPSQPSSIAAAASDAVPTPASTRTGTFAPSTISRIVTGFWMPSPDPIGAPSGMIATAPAFSSRFAAIGSSAQ